MSTTKLFPIGTMSDSESIGTIDSINYNMFEPNSGCSSIKQHNILVSPFLSQVLQTRKRSDPFLMITYKYSDIFSKEFRQIEHFLYDNESSLNSFLCIDWSKGFTPNSITLSSNDWVISTLNTNDYSIYNGYKASRVFVWYAKAKKFRVGSIAALTANTSFTVDLDANEYGDLSVTNANSYGTVYPLYESYVDVKDLSGFRTNQYVPGYDISASAVGGFMYSGEIKFVSKYKV